MTEHNFSHETFYPPVGEVGVPGSTAEIGGQVRVGLAAERIGQLIRGPWITHEASMPVRGYEDNETYGLTKNQQKIFAPPVPSDESTFEGRQAKYFKPNRDVTVESSDAAEKALSSPSLDPELKESIRDSARNQDIGLFSTKAVMDFVRTNSGVRYKLASNLLRELEALINAGLTPTGVGRSDEPVSPARDYGGYSEISSRDYVVALALSMLDGTFQPEKASPEEDRLLKQRQFSQHRGVVRRLLFRSDA